MGERLWVRGYGGIIFFILMIGIIFSGCSKVYIAPDKTPYPEAEVIYPPSTEESQGIPVPDGEHDIEEYDIIRPPQKEPPKIGSPTDEKQTSQESYMLAGVERLMDRAKQQMALENFDHAFATAERALRIDDSNPALWNLLAEIQLKRGNATQAEQLAKKSNLLAKGDIVLQAKNWRIISDALNRQGYILEAEQALRKAEKLEGKNIY